MCLVSSLEGLDDEEMATLLNHPDFSGKSPLHFAAAAGRVNSPSANSEIVLRFIKCFIIMNMSTLTVFKLHM